MNLGSDEDDWLVDALQNANKQIAALMAENEALREKIKQKDRQLSDYSWQTNPDRMGGQFTEEEIRAFRADRY